MLRKTTIAAIWAAVSATAAFAGPEISIHDAYARSAMASSKSGAAFFEIKNSGDEADKLIEVYSDVAMRTELHTHKDRGDGVMQMRPQPQGFSIPAMGAHTLKRGADHVMFMGLKQPFEHGKNITVTLVFEISGQKEIQIPVDLER